MNSDGTFFAAAHHVRETPMLGINSDPATSLALFSCCDRSDFREKLDLALDGKLSAVNLNRMEVAINDRVVPTLAFNDVLFAHRTPAAMTRYEIAMDGRKERQRGSRVWIATAAGGKRMAIESKAITFPSANKPDRKVGRNDAGLWYNILRAMLLRCYVPFGYTNKKFPYVLDGLPPDAIRLNMIAGSADRCPAFTKHTPPKDGVILAEPDRATRPDFHTTRRERDTTASPGEAGRGRSLR